MGQSYKDLALSIDIGGTVCVCGGVVPKAEWPILQSSCHVHSDWWHCVSCVLVRLRNVERMLRKRMVCV